ncbi:hypothetical protein GCM10008942_40260 [Rhizomicrobium electricum]|uniref:Uncharacterized protein n=1 Tax=Rhizomicrobium electricum TaxID=480070 RepID=A0ABN1FBF6_9PROT
MTNEPTAYDRFRDSRHLPPLDWQVCPTAGEAFIDKTKIILPGTIEFANDHLLRQWFLQLAENMLDHECRLFGNPDCRSTRYWSIETVTHGWTIGAELTVKPAGSRANWTLALNLNPTRTLVHLQSRYQPCEFHSLFGREFFVAQPAAHASIRSLDQHDNMLLGRYVPGAQRARERYLSVFLETFELGLQRLVQELLCETAPGRFFTYDGPSITWPQAASDGHHDSSAAATVRVNWGEISLSQCEVYWERRVARALPWMRAFADHALAAARDVRIRRYETERELVVAREAGSLVVTIPLDATRSRHKAEKELVVYAKDDDRIRFEVRYHSNLPDVISNSAPRDFRRLSSLFMAARADALTRLPWLRFGEIMREAPPVPASELIPLVDFIRQETERHPGAFRGALEALLLTGGISETDGGGWASAELLTRLVRRGVLEPSRLVRHQRGTKRYRLARRYLGLLTLFRLPGEAEPLD